MQIRLKAECTLTKGKYAGTIHWLSSEDVEAAKNIGWNLVPKGYLQGCVDGKNIRMHQFVMNRTDSKKPQCQCHSATHLFLKKFPTCYIIDHKDNNPLNNCRENLRWVTSADNNLLKLAHEKPNKNNKGGVRGIQYDERLNTKPWHARITIDYNEYNSYFATFEEALEWRRERCNIALRERGLL